MVTEAIMPFEEWLKTETKKAYIDFAPDPESNNAKQAAIHRLHVWTRPETAAAFNETYSSITASAKGVLAK